MIKYDFNREWTYYKEGSDSKKKVNLPHDAMIYERRNRENPSGGACAYFDGGKYIYEKQFHMEEEWRDKVLILECEGVYHNATVILNGNKIGKRAYGYSNFYTELTPYLKADNMLEIIADNEKTPNSRWYSGSGIYRGVNLYVSEKNYIKPNGVKIDTLTESKISVKTDFVGMGNINVKIYDKDSLVAEGKGQDVEIVIPNVKLWDEDAPYLYRCCVELTNDGIVNDSQETKFGIRTIKWSGKGLFINGKNTLLRGTCIHHDNGVIGACNFRDAEYRRVRILKEAGFNAIRSSHNPISKEMLEACDEIGMYVMDELYDYWLIHKNPYDHADNDFLNDWKKDCEAMIDKDYNHPSVLMYSIGNEISELGTEKGQSLCKEMAEYVKAKDSKRAVTCGINLLLATMAAKGSGIYGEKKDGKENKNGSMSMDSMPTSTFYNILMNKMGGIIDKMAAKPSADKVCDILAPLLDISGYNYATSRYDKEQKQNSDRCIVGSERLPKTLYDNWQYVKKNDNLIGDFMWTGWDYIGETGIGTIRYMSKQTRKNAIPGLPILAGCGVIDICGNMRPEVGWNKLIWGLQDTPVLAVEPMKYTNCKRAASMWRNTDAVASWSWDGCEGNKSDVIVYTTAEYAELFCNGRKVGRSKVNKMKATFKRVTYEPGELIAKCYDRQGREIGTAKLISATGKSNLKLTAEKNTLNSNGQDLCYVQVDLVGDNGITKVNSDQVLTVEVKGAGVLQGFGSATPCTNHNYYNGKFETFYGKAIAVIRAGYEPGEIELVVRGEGLEEKQVKINVNNWGRFFCHEECPIGSVGGMVLL